MAKLLACLKPLTTDDDTSEKILKTHREILNTPCSILFCVCKYLFTPSPPFAGSTTPRTTADG